MQKLGNDIAWTLLDFGIDLADVFSDDAEAQELHPADEPDGAESA